MSKTNPEITADPATNPAPSTPPTETEAQIAERRARADAETDHRFHGWRLLGVIFAVVVVLAVTSAVVDWLVIGPLEGRMF